MILHGFQLSQLSSFFFYICVVNIVHSLLLLLLKLFAQESIGIASLQAFIFYTLFLNNLSWFAIYDSEVVENFEVESRVV